MIRFQCECGQTLQGKDEDAGRQAKCPSCGRVSVIPRPDAVKQSEAPRRESPRADAVRRERPDDRDDEEDRPRRGDRDDDYDDDDRPRRGGRAPQATSGKAWAALILGLLSFPCVVGTIFTGLPAILFGILAMSEIDKSRGRVGGKGMALTGLITGAIGVVAMLPLVLIGLLLPAVQKVRDAAARTQDANNLKQVALGMHMFHDVNNGFPQAAAFRSPEGKPLLSWRVALLPYIEQQALYMQFKLDEPWDSAHNKELLRVIPRVYLQPGEQPDGTGLTRYQVFVGPGTIFEEPLTKPGEKPLPGDLPLFLGKGTPLRGHPMNSIMDGTSNTILVTTADRGVPWTKPEDLVFDPRGPLPALSRRFPSGFNTAMADGSVRLVSFATSEQTLRNAITRNDGMPLGPDW
jgi:hypothetical protein